jgi:hypothetical protein
LGESGDRGKGEFGEKIRLDELEETLDLSPPLRIVRGTKDALDAKGGANGVEVIGGEDLGLIDVECQGATVAEDGALETILHTGELLVPIELGVRDETGVIIEEGKEEGLALAGGVGRVRKARPIHSVALPEVAEVVALEAAIGFGTVFDEELGSSGTTVGKVATKSTGSDVVFGDGVGVIEGKDADDGAGGAEGLLPLERLGTIKRFAGDGTRNTSVRARLGFEAIEAVQEIGGFPAGQG